MSAAEQAAAGCAGKSGFVRWSDARRRARRMARRDGRYAQPYRCVNCGLIHLGSNEITRKQVQAHRRKKEMETLREIEEAA